MEHKSFEVTRSKKAEIVLVGRQLSSKFDYDYHDEVFLLCVFVRFFIFLIILLIKKMHIVSLIVCPDSENLQRLDPALLSQQALMEMLVEGFKDKSMFQDKNGNYADISEWPHVFLKDGRVVELSTRDFPSQIRRLENGPSGKFGGTLNLQFLPNSVKYLTITGQAMTGTINTKFLSAEMYSLQLSKNAFEGSFALDSLPPSISEVSIKENNFCGALNLSCSLPNLRHFWAQSNKFQGSIDLENLPKSLEILNLEDNQLVGSANLNKLPQRLLHLFLGRNSGLCGALFTSALSPWLESLTLSHMTLRGNVKLADVMHQTEKFHEVQYSAFDVPKSIKDVLLYTGTVEFTRLPKSIDTLELEHCSLEGTANLKKLPKKMKKLSIAHNKLSGLVRFREYYYGDELRKMHTLNISDNAFSGGLFLEKLPRNLRHFNASSNNLSGCVDFSKMTKSYIKVLDISNNANLRGKTDGSKLWEHLRVLKTEGTKIERNDEVSRILGDDSSSEESDFSDYDSE